MASLLRYVLRSYADDDMSFLNFFRSPGTTKRLEPNLSSNKSIDQSTTLQNETTVDKKADETSETILPNVVAKVTFIDRSGGGVLQCTIKGVVHKDVYFDRDQVEGDERLQVGGEVICTLRSEGDHAAWRAKELCSRDEVWGANEEPSFQRAGTNEEPSFQMAGTNEEPSFQTAGTNYAKPIQTAAVNMHGNLESSVAIGRKYADKPNKNSDINVKSTDNNRESLIQDIHNMNDSKGEKCSGSGSLAQSGSRISGSNQSQSLLVVTQFNEHVSLEDGSQFLQTAENCDFDVMEGKKSFFLSNFGLDMKFHPLAYPEVVICTVLPN